MTLKTGSAGGYTLVELVVVMLLLGMIALACESGLHFGAQVWSRTEEPARLDAQIVSAQTILRTLMSHTLPRAKGVDVAFDGEPMAMDFDLVPPEAFGGGGTAHAKLRIVQARGSARLEVELRSIAAPNIKKRAILLGDVGLMRFSYLDMSEKSSTWLAFWRDRSRLPAAIRIAGSDPAVWPALIVRPVLVQSATCVLDSEELACRKI